MSEDEVFPYYGKDQAGWNKWIHRLFNIQMEDWLEYAYEHRHEHKTIQGRRIPLSGENTKPSGLPKLVGGIRSNITGKDLSPSKHKKRISNKKINTWTLYKEWVSNWKERQPNDNSKNNSIYLHYTDAVPELHALLDFMENEGFPEFEPAP